MSFFPSGKGSKSECLVNLGDKVVQLSAFKKAEDSKDYIIRLFEPTGKERETTIKVPVLNIVQRIKLGGFEIKTLKLDVERKAIMEVSLTEF